jgi:DNA-binding Xre family transcriptional regulator
VNAKLLPAQYDIAIQEFRLRIPNTFKDTFNLNIVFIVSSFWLSHYGSDSLVVAAAVYSNAITPSSNILRLPVIFPPMISWFRMIKTHVQEIARKRGITTAYQLQKALDISPSVAAKLWSDEFELISRTSLDRLCSFLKVQPHRLITFSRPKMKN